MVAITRNNPIRTLLNPVLRCAADAPLEVAITEMMLAPIAWCRSTTKKMVRIGTSRIPPPSPSTGADDPRPHRSDQDSHEEGRHWHWAAPVTGLQG